MPQNRNLRSPVAWLLTLVFAFGFPLAPAYSRPLITESSVHPVALASMANVYDVSGETDFCSRVLAEHIYADGVDTFDELAASGVNGRPAEILAELIAEQIRRDNVALGFAPDTVLTDEERAYVAEWKPRIDDYLDGSPLEGKGAYFALSAYRHGVDPRISPAIATKESGLGRKCFRSHNAWGMMGHSFSTWEEGIDANNALIARLGGSITLSFARKYCPPTAECWYSGVTSLMRRM